MATEPNRTEPNRTEIIHDLENNFTQNKILQLKSLFPEAFCEEQIDWEKLKLILGADNLAHQNERYQLNWAGKTDAYRTLQAPTFNTLSPCRAESVDFDGTRNLFIEAENLEALKILQKAYAGSVKMIYIDPPYNTGSDSFIYPDKFSETREEYARRVGDKDADGYLKRDGVFQGAWRKNPRENGHYHSNWLSMMLPRLHLARTLLRDDGVIFISIDDNEQAQLKLLCDEVFGAENFVGQFPWRKRTAKSDVPFGVSADYEFILAYAKSTEFVASVEGKERRYFETDDFPNRPWRIHDLTKQTKASERPNSFFTLKDPKTGKEYPANPLRTWAVTQDTFQEYYDAGKIVFPDDYDFLNISNPVMRYFKDDDMAKAGEKFGRIAVSTKLPENVGMSLNGTKEITDLFDGKLFDFPKPSSLISFFLNTLHDDQALILDFFSGSGTTAHAVMQLNAKDGGNRRYICVQLPEETDEKSEARKAGFDTIAEIAKERIRRAGAAVSGSLKDGQRVDTGFKVFKLSESSFKQWRQPENGADLEQQLRLAIDSVAEHAAPKNMVYELMLRLGCKLTSPVEHKNGVYWVTDEDTGKRIALLLEAADQTLIDDVIAAAPAKVVALDKWFDGNDALKSNTVLQMKDAGIVFECV
ncbi:DNA (cytosine-5-)-methyltransferase [Neisseria sp. oral taxon 020 str. F0370]|uniref:site-specific DNA-methyltransferase n=1 Tax=Neisseria sp. oral taxon 020 TaxID=712401 RepID=UPI0002A1F23F|nr:site-specific DNA-methyltransferase [Neisseria sp. oral taxon 020]EKY05522.1 DNA (cytosine-5-)-methyltransferase [Neisseria sp. oral taxon 020 str. F0370]